ncbi:MAG: TOBE domain-containing protein, partial [Pseudomonadota bacterium]
NNLRFARPGASDAEIRRVVEDLELAGPDDGNAIGAQVVVVEPTGAETLVSCDCFGHELLAAVKERTALRPGATARFSFPPHKPHFFDPDTGAAL